MVYKGIALNENLENGRRSCIIEVSPSCIDFVFSSTSDSGEAAIGNKPVADRVRFPMYKIKFASGGAGTRLIYFTHPENPGWTFYCGDINILKDPYLLKNEDSRKSISTVKTGNRSLVTAFLSLIILIIVSLGTIFFFRKIIIFEIAETIPVEWEQKAGESIFKTITYSSALVKDVTLDKKVNELGSKLTSVVENRDIKFKFYIVEDSTLNAFALPGGNVVLHSGLILKAANAEEVLGVIGHEIAHVTQRHHARGLITRMGLNFILSFFFIPDSEIADLIINTGGSLQSLKYDREFESESDDKGLEYLQKANINPNGMISFFQKIEKESSQPSMLDFLSSHPAVGDRIEVIKKKISKSKKRTYSPVSFDFKTFQKQLKEKINQ